MDYKSLMDYFFKKTKQYMFYSELLLTFSLLLSVSSVFIKIDFVKIGTVIIAVLLLILFWIYSLKQKEFNHSAHSVRKIEILHFIGNIHWLNLELAKILPEINTISSLPEDIISTQYTPPKEINCFRKNSFRILENCFWNKFLYRKMLHQQINSSILLTTIIIFLLLLLFLYNKDTKINYDVYTSLLILVSSTWFFRRLQNIHLTYLSANIMSELHTEILRTDSINAEKFNFFFLEYFRISYKTPNIPKKLYEKYKESLNHSWQLELNNIKLSDFDNEIYRSLKILFQILNKNNINACVTGSTSLYLNKAIDKNNSNDIDIMIPKRQIEITNNVLKTFEVKEISYSQTGNLKSYYGNYIIGNVMIDVFSELKFLEGGEWKENNLLEHCREINLGGEIIKFTLLEYELNKK